MGSERTLKVSGGRSAAATAGDDQRVEELLRVNARLAAEVRSLTLGNSNAPRAGSMPAARRLAALNAERDRLAQDLHETRADLSRAGAELEQALARREALEREVAELAATVVDLRAGVRGLLRRLLNRIGR